MAVKKRPPCPAYDLERLESWLADMAQEGLHLQKISRFGRFVFTQDTPCNVRYRLEAAQSRLDDQPPQEMLDLGREYGWDFVDKFGEFFIFRSRNPGSPELNTDPAIQALTLRALKRRSRISLLCLILYLAVFFGTLMSGFCYHMANEGTLLLLGLCMLMALDFAERIHAVVIISQLYRRLSAGGPPRHDKTWQKSVPLHHIQRGVTLIFAVMLLLGAIGNIIPSKKDLSEYPGLPPFVTLEELAPEDAEVHLSKINNGNYESRSDPLIPVNIQWLDGGEAVYSDGCHTSGLLRIHYMETSAPWLARAIAKDYLDYFSFQYESDAVGLDLDVEYSAAFYDRFGMARVVLAEDTTVVCAIFSMSDTFGNFTLENWAALMADMLT